jgi:excisionase family DNA binding protein
MDKLLLTPQEAAAALSIGRTKVYELMESGLLESVTIGRCRRVPAEALAPFVESLRQGPGQAEQLSARMVSARSMGLPDGANMILFDDGGEDMPCPRNGAPHEHQPSPSQRRADGL